MQKSLNSIIYVCRYMYQFKRWAIGAFKIRRRIWIFRVFTSGFAFSPSKGAFNAWINKYSQKDVEKTSEFLGYDYAEEESEGGAGWKSGKGGKRGEEEGRGGGFLLILPVFRTFWRFVWSWTKGEKLGRTAVAVPTGSPGITSHFGRQYRAASENLLNFRKYLIADGPPPLSRVIIRN